MSWVFDNPSLNLSLSYCLPIEYAFFWTVTQASGRKFSSIIALNIGDLYLLPSCDSKLFQSKFRTVMLILQYFLDSSR